MVVLQRLALIRCSNQENGGCFATISSYSLQLPGDAGAEINVAEVSAHSMQIM